MRYDPKLGWLLSKQDFEQAGFDDDDYYNGRRRGYVNVVQRACKGRRTEIIFRDLPDRIKVILKQKLVFLNEEQQRHMLEAKMMGVDMTEFAIEVTANTIKINTPFVLEELKAYIKNNFHKYTPHYLQLGISGTSVVGYSKICALATWVYNMVIQIMSMNDKKRDQNRMMRSLRANLLSALDHMPPLEVKIPTNDVRFMYWIEDVVEKMNKGIPVEEVIEIKRKGNSNTTKLTPEQELFVGNLNIYGNALSIMQVYEKLKEHGRGAGWWRNKNTGEYDPVSYGTIRNYVLANCNQAAFAREDPARFFNMRVVQFTRSYPKKINEGWGIDGTAHNENVFWRGNVKQYVYAIRVYDYASFKLLNTEVTISVNEPAELLIEAVKGAIKAAGYLPSILQCDRGPGYKGLGEFCHQLGIHLLPAGAGRARSKVIELLIGQFDEMIGKFLRGWSGKNRTASGENSQPSEEFYKKGKSAARSAEEASRDLRTRLTEIWNSHIIGEREGEPCNKTPNELWNSLESATTMLPYLELVRLIGTKHTVKLHNDGAEIQHDRKKYLYFPPITTDKERSLADEIFARIPRGKHEASQVDIYIIQYGDPAPVYYNTRFCGIWDIKKTVPYFATFEKDTKDYNDMRKLQELQIENARNYTKGLRSELEKHPDAEKLHDLAMTPLTGKIRVTGRLEKQQLNASEIMEKDGILTPDPVALFNQEVSGGTDFKRLVDPDTGEEYIIPTNNL